METILLKRQPYPLSIDEWKEYKLNEKIIDSKLLEEFVTNTVTERINRSTTFLLKDKNWIQYQPERRKIISYNWDYIFNKWIKKRKSNNKNLKEQGHSKSYKRKICNRQSKLIMIH